MKKFLFLFAITAATGCTLPDLAIDVDVDATLPDGWTLPEDVEDPPSDGENTADTTDTTDTADAGDSTVFPPDSVPPVDTTDTTVPDATPDTTPDTGPPPNCGDGNKCTIEYFDDEVGDCVYFDVGCFDGIECTLDTCEPETGCVFVFQQDEPGCCQNQDDCDDDDPCTFDTCEANSCVYTQDPDPACCLQDSDCDDDDACTVDACTETGCTNTYVGAPECCDVHTDCDDGDSCTFDMCSLNGCLYIDTCCTFDIQCGTSDSCANIACEQGWCIQTPSFEEGCCDPSAPLLSEAFDGPLSEEWELSNSSLGVQWTVLENEEGESYLAYGNSPDWSPLLSEPHQAVLITPDIALPSGVPSTLSLDLWPEIQAEPFLDVLTIEVQAADGTHHPILDKASLQLSSWQTIVLQLNAWAGQTIRIVLRYDSSNTDNNQSIGLAIDNIQIASTCTPLTCTEATDCGDGLTSTNENCVEGSCAYALDLNTCSPHDPTSCQGELPCRINQCVGLQCTQDIVENCCTSPLECDDGVDCTLDSCVFFDGNDSSGVCQSIPWFEPCCTSNADCNDNNPCTDDYCHPDGCLFNPIPGCCASNEECEDGDTCTTNLCVSGTCQSTNACCVSDQECSDGESECSIETCVAGTCTSTPTGQEGCCTSMVYEASFAGLTDFLSWYTSDDSDESDNVGWQLQNTWFTSPPYALYYGNPETWSYDTGSQANHESVTSYPIEIPAGEGSWLSFQLYLANEYSVSGYPNADFDRLVVEAVTGDTETLLWESASPEPIWWKEGPNGEILGAQWTGMGPFPLPPSEDGMVRIRFRFNTYDGSSNAHLGVVIDDLRIEQACP